MKITINPNSETARRARKAGKLLAEIEARVGRCGGDDAGILVAWIEGLTDQAWIELADIAKCNPPGPKTVQLIVELVRALATRGAA